MGKPDTADDPFRCIGWTAVGDQPLASLHSSIGPALGRLAHGKGAGSKILPIGAPSHSLGGESPNEAYLLSPAKKTDPFG